MVVSMESRPRPPKHAQNVLRSVGTSVEYQPKFTVFLRSGIFNVPAGSEMTLAGSRSIRHTRRNDPQHRPYERRRSITDVIHSVQYGIDSPVIRFDYNRMDYRQLQYFIAVAEELSFTRAAKRLHISQPPLSIQIKALEQEIGTSLLSRSRRKVELTPAGQLLLENAKKAIGHLEHTTDVVRRAGLGQAGVIRLAFTGSVPMREAFAKLLRTFRQSYPDVRFELQHMATGRQFEALAQDTIDVGILRPPASLARGRVIEQIPIWRERLMLFVPIDHPLAASRTPVKMAALIDQAFVGVESTLSCGMQDHLITLCSAAGFVPRLEQEARELSTVLGLVAAGIGIAVLPECYSSMMGSSVASLPIASNDAEGTLVLALKADNASPLLRRFVDVAHGLSRNESLLNLVPRRLAKAPIRRQVMPKNKVTSKNKASHRKAVAGSR
jgi:DNA-binding transcriptional LysR family regulator